MQARARPTPTPARTTISRSWRSIRPTSRRSIRPCRAGPGRADRRRRCRGGRLGVLLRQLGAAARHRRAQPEAGSRPAGRRRRLESRRLHAHAGIPAPGQRLRERRRAGDRRPEHARAGAAAAVKRRRRRRQGARVHPRQQRVARCADRQRHASVSVEPADSHPRGLRALREPGRWRRQSAGRTTRCELPCAAWTTRSSAR